MSHGPDFTQVEQPFIDQLVSMGWKHTTGSSNHPNVRHPASRDIP